MKFDLVIGNPPFQDSSNLSANNKIYLSFIEKSLSLLSNEGILSFLTPVSGLKKSKRLKIDLSNVSYVNFDVSKWFPRIGTKIVAWVYRQSLKDKSRVIVSSNESQRVPSTNETIIDPSIVDSEFLSFYKSFRKLKINERMFLRNGIVGSKRSNKEDVQHPFTIRKLDDLNTSIVDFFYSVEPKLYERKKIIIPLTKSIDKLDVSEHDFNQNHVFCLFESDEQLRNVKSFLLSDYFIEHCSKWKKLEGYGFNQALVYLPKFDTTKYWTNEAVRQFLIQSSGLNV